MYEGFLAEPQCAMTPSENLPKRTGIVPETPLAASIVLKGLLQDLFQPKNWCDGHSAVREENY